MKRRTTLTTHTLAAVTTIALLFTPASTFAQITFGPGGITIGPGAGGRGDYDWRGGRGGGDCAKWQHQCATEGRRCDRVQNFCGGMGRVAPHRFQQPAPLGATGRTTRSHPFPRSHPLEGRGHAQCPAWAYECQTQGRHCSRLRDLC